jgi:hypothetical protein
MTDGRGESIFNGIGPILDLPLDFGLGTLDQGHYVLLSAFHQHAIGSCYNSFIVPVQNDIESLAKRLPDPHALEALYALGFRTIVLHGDVRSPDVPKILRGLRGLAGLPSGGTRLVEIGEAAKHWAFRVESDVPVDATFAALTGTDGGESVATVSPPSTLVDFTFRNGDGAAYRHPVPVEPTALRVRWEDRSGGVTSESTVRVLLPLALARGEEMRRKIPLPVPARPGSYRLTVAPVTAADVVIARRDVEVVAPASATGTGDRR